MRLTWNSTLDRDLEALKPRTRNAVGDLADRFAAEGFASIPALGGPADVAEIRALLDPLFERFATLGERALDVGGLLKPGVAPRSPEINEAAVLEPRLRHTVIFLRCREIARRVLRVPVGYQFDHAIYKAPHNRCATEWHQDEAYNEEPIPLRSVHFWIPLQPVDVANGCMQFIPRSHLGPKFPHYIVSPRARGGTLAAHGVDARRSVACPLTLGGATLHHPMTLHFTGPNHSSHWRRAWIVHFAAYGKLRHRLHPKGIAAKLARCKPG